jgi:hypothetical protein
LSPQSEGQQEHVRKEERRFEVDEKLKLGILASGCHIPLYCFPVIPKDER